MIEFKPGTKIVGGKNRRICLVSDGYVFLTSSAVRGRQYFISESVKLKQIASNLPWLQYCSIWIGASGVTDRANTLHLNDILIFDFFENNNNVYGG